jgi:hypothetical protein
MKNAKAFLYVSLGILALAVAFHLGAQSAQGQATNGAQGGEFMVGTGLPPCVSGAWGRTVYYANLGLSGAPFGGGVLPVPVPGGDPIVATRISEWYEGTVPGVFVLVANGDCYYWDSSSWLYLGNLNRVGPVQTVPSTWGRIKAERR